MGAKCIFCLVAPLAALAADDPDAFLNAVVTHRTGGSADSELDQLSFCCRFEQYLSANRVGS